LPEEKAISTVKVVKRESLSVNRLWQESRQGMLAKVLRAQFDAYYANQESGIGVWVGGKASLKTFLAVRGSRSPDRPSFRPLPSFRFLKSIAVENAIAL
jgi:hypothetical protein